MPEQIKVSDFVRETWDDYNSPTTSTFITRMGHCRNTVSILEETLDSDRSGLNKMKKSVKALYNTGSSHVLNEAYLAENLEKLGTASSQKEQDSDIGAAFQKFAVVTKELSALMKNLMQNLNNVLMFPLDSFLKGDLRGVKGDLKKPFDKAWKEYETKFNKIEKEKKQLAKDAGMIKTGVTGAEVAEDVEKERGMFQLQMTEYLIKVNDIKTKKGTDLLQHLVEYYYAQNNYFTDGMKTIDHYKCYIEDLVAQLSKIKQRQDVERKDLIELRDALKTSMASYNRESVSTSNQYSLHQLQGNKAHGYERTGYLLKKSEGKMRKVWQKRKCIVKDGFLSINHADVSKPPVKLNLLTCQVKLIYDDPGKKCFDLISSSKNRTYHFQAEDTQEMEAWISVLNNAKESVLMKAFGESNDKESSPMNQSIKELTRTILEEVKRLPGNRYCCDCGAPDPEWLSVNLGVLICLECCGVHREMGVHISRTQSIVIDDLGTSQLLLARVVSNGGFNEIMEAKLDIKYKPSATSDMEERKNFIRAKYERKRYAIITCTNPDDRKSDLKQAVVFKDIYALLQVYAEGINFMEPLPDTPKNQTALHLAIEEEDNRSLYMVDFMTQNSNAQTLLRPDRDGNNCLHYCAQLDRTECMKLLLRIQPDLVNYENSAGETPLEIARDSGNELCVELINSALSGKHDLFNNVNIDWGLVSDDHSYDDVDYSDDDLDKVQTPDRKSRSRPGSLVMSSEQSLPMSIPSSSGNRERSMTVDFKSTTLPKEIIMGPPPDRTGSTKAKQSLILPGGLSGSTQSLVTTLQRRKAPAPPPPTYRELQRHSRKHSDPGFGSSHYRSPSDPPPLPEKVNRQGSPNTKSALPGDTTTKMRRRSYAGIFFPSGAKLVLPPPPEFRGNEPNAGDRPSIAPKPSQSNPRKQSSQSSSDDYIMLDTQPPHHQPASTFIDTAANRKSSIQVAMESKAATRQLQGELMTNSIHDIYSGSSSSYQGVKPEHNHHHYHHQQHSNGNNHHGSTPSVGGMMMVNTDHPQHHQHSGNFVNMDIRNSNMSQSANFNGHRTVRDRGGSTDSQGSSSSREGLLGNDNPPVRSNERCRALYDCEADNEDELSFREGEVIIVCKEEEDEWWEGYIEGSPTRRGMFPTTFVEVIPH